MLWQCLLRQLRLCGGLHGLLWRLHRCCGLRKLLLPSLLLCLLRPQRLMRQLLPCLMRLLLPSCHWLLLCLLRLLLRLHLKHRPLLHGPLPGLHSVAGCGHRRLRPAHRQLAADARLPW